MAIGENFRVSRFGGDFCSLNGYSMVRDIDQRKSSLFHSSIDIGGDDDAGMGCEEDDVASGIGSDDFDLSDFGEIGYELCRVGNSNCSLPLELYDLPDLTGVLCLDTWNDCLTEEERFSLAEYLPDMDQGTFARTLKELLDGSNFQFGSPVTRLFDMLKGGLCEPRVALYCRGLNSFEERQHYHLLRKYQNSMVSSIIQIRDAWEGCAAYRIEERLRLLNILRNKKSLMYEEGDRLGLETDSSATEESINGLRTKMGKDGHGLGDKSSGHAVYTGRLPLDEMATTLMTAKYRKQNSKDVSDVSAQKASSKKDDAAVFGHFPSPSHGLEMKSRPSVLSSSLHQHDQVVGYNSGVVRQSQGHIRVDGHEGEQTNKMGVQRNWNMGLGATVAKVNPLKSGKKWEFLNNCDSDMPLGLGEDVTDSYIGMPFRVRNVSFPYAKINNARTVGMIVKPVNDRYYEHGKKAKNPKKLHQNSLENQFQYAKKHGWNIVPEGSPVGWSASIKPFRQGNTQEESLSVDHQDKLDDWNFINKKVSIGEQFKTIKRSAGHDSKIRTCRTSSPQMNESYFLFLSDHRTRTSDKNTRRNYSQNGGLKMGCRRDSDIFTQYDAIESGISEQVDKDEDVIHSTRRLGYHGVITGGGLSAPARSGGNPQMVNQIAREVAEFPDKALPTSIDVGDPGPPGRQSHLPEIEIFYSGGEKRGKLSEPSYLDTDQQIYKSMDSQMQGDLSERLKVLLLKASSERKLKQKFATDSSELGSNYMNMHSSGYLGNLENLEGGGLEHPNVSGKKGQITEVRVTDTNFYERSTMALWGCNSVTWKHKKGDVRHVDGLHSSLLNPNDESKFSKKQLKRKVDDEPGYSPMVTSDALTSQRGIADLKPETKPLKKPFTLITPSSHTGFSFSIIHLLTAVRMAMITVHAEAVPEAGNHLEKIDGREKLKDGLDGNHERGARVLSHGGLHMDCSEHTSKKNVPSLTVQEIVDRVRSNPRDPCIVETQEPLQDLVRGVLKVFSSKTAPLGAKGWKALVSYEKSTKSWSWIGPISSSSDHETGEEETSAEAWDVPHKMLVKLVDSFANWLKNGQEALKLIGSLPPPPKPTPDMDEKERFRDLRAQKSLITINPSSDEVRTYFRKEEFLRYSIPDRAFSYTAADGRKSTVAPLRRGGKPTSKARGHLMLKLDRPPHVTILCIVRDAAARLPGSIGTRADVCTLIRDSQYIVEDVSDTQVSQIVSGALDRLHYELDPCVRFDGERKLWVYLHRDRDEEDFEDDGTSSTKKWKRPRKEPPDLSSYIGGADDVIGQGTGDRSCSLWI